MSAPLVKKELRRDLIPLTIYSFASVAMVWLYVAMYPSLQKQGQQLAKVFESFPPALLKAFNIEGTGLESLEALLNSELFNFIWPILVSAFVLSRAANYLAGEAERNTIGTLLSQPVSRAKLFWSKYFSGVISLIVFTFVSFMSTVPLAHLYHLRTPVQAYWLLTAMGVLFAWSIYSIGMLCSAIVNSKSQVYALVGGSLLAMYVANLVASLKPELNSLKYLSFFHYFDPNRLLLHREFSWPAALLFGGISVVGAIVGMLWFSRRDYNI